MISSIKDFIYSLYNEDGSFSFSSENTVANLYSTCFGVMSLSSIGQLKSFPHKDKVVRFIRAHQNHKSGYFEDKTLNVSEDALHNGDYVLWQLTDFSTMALNELGEKPKCLFNFLVPYKNVEYLTSWFYSLDWSNPWLISNSVMFLLNILILEDEISNQEYIDFLIDLLDQVQEDRTGFWGLSKKPSLHNKMAAAYHFMIFYTYCSRKIKNLQQIIDSTTLLADSNGLFSNFNGGGSCDDLDGVDILCRASLYTRYRNEAIKQILGKSHSSLLMNQNEDGGFSWSTEGINGFHLGDIFKFKLLSKLFVKDFLVNIYNRVKQNILILSKRSRTWRYSGIKSMEISVYSSDLLSTWFRSATIAFIEKTYPELISKKQNTIVWNLRNKSGLTFYKND